MILFQEDWARERATIHENTQNHTWVRAAMVLKKMGIQNCYFPLALIDQDLARYDPRNLTDTSTELRLRIAAECKSNPWYLFREVIMVPAQGGVAQPLRANRGSLAMIWCFFNNIGYIAIQPRQTGKALVCDALIKTPTGWTRMGDISVGDVVTVPDGTTSRVIGVYPQGLKPIYRITFIDGRSSECCDEHLWKVRDEYAFVQEWEILTLNEIHRRMRTRPSWNTGLFIPRVDGDIRSNGEAYLGIKSIEYIGLKEAQCIEIDHPDHLYITNDFIVTHNTIVACAIIASVMYILGNDLAMTLYTKDIDLIEENVVRIKVIRQALPDYLYHHQRRDTDNKQGLSYEALNNRYLTAVAKPDKQGADNLGRGMTTPVHHIDEPAFCTNIDITYPVMMFSKLAAIESAKKNGQPHSNILTTTAANTDTPRGKFAFNMVNRAMPFTEKMYDLQNNEEALTLVKANSANDLVNGTYSYFQLGYTRAWYDAACRMGEATQEVNDRELLNIWKSGSEASLLDALTIQILNDNKREPHFVEILHSYFIKWYVPEDYLRSSEFRSRKFILGMDSSENVGEDFTTLVMIDVADLSVVCTFRCNESNTIKVAMFIAEFLMKYSNVTFIPERNSTGGTIIDMIVMVFSQNRINPWRRIYSTVIQNRKDPAMEKINLDDPTILDTSTKKHLGFRTSTKTRPYLYTMSLKKAAKLNAERVYDTTLISELSTLSTERGRVDHSDGNHDDMVIAWLLACWLIFYGENLYYYGIDARNIMNSITSDGSQIDPGYRDRQLEIRRELKILQDKLESSRTDYLKNMYQRRIFVLQNSLDDDITVEPIGVAKVEQDTLDYGKAHYIEPTVITPLQSEKAASNMSRLFNLLY